MNTNVLHSEPRAVDFEEAHEAAHETRNHNAPWNLEEIDEPDVWSLTSFDDLLPQMA